MRFSKLDWGITPDNWKVIYRANGNMECQYDIVKYDDGLWYCTVYQYGKFADEKSFDTKNAARSWANTQDTYLEI